MDKYATSKWIIMSGWKEYKLKEVYNFGSGLSKPRSEFGFGYGFLSYKDIFHNYFVPDELKELVNSTEKEQLSCSVKKGDVFLTRTSETDEDLGMSCVALKDYPNATFNGFTKRLRPNGNVAIIPEYAGFYFRNPKFRANISGISSITTRASLNNEMLASLSILIPPLNEQRGIADTLKSIYDKIDLLHRQNKTLEQLAETLFRQWFVEEAEENWKIGTIDDVVSMKGGTTPSTNESKFWDGNVHWTSPRDLSNTTSIFLFDTSRKITEEGLKQISSGLLPIGTLLLSSRAPIGYLALTEIPVAINQGYIAIICNKIVSNYYMYLWCIANMETIENAGNGSVFQEISKSAFRTLKFLIPPKEKLKMFDIEIEPLFKKIKSNTQQIRTLTQLRDTLLPKLMSGEVKIKLQK